MIKPESLNLSALPFVSLPRKSALPALSGIYFAVDSLGTIQYIGKADNLKSRWKHHHRLSQLTSESGVKIAYLLADAAVLPKIESDLILFFRPRLNGERFEGSSYSAAANSYRSKPGEYGETKKQKQFLLTPTASRMLDELGSEYKMTRSDLIENIIRGIHSWDKVGRDRLMLQIGVIEDEEEQP